MPFEPDLTLAEARAIIDRAIEKARALKQAAAFVVVDVGGNVVSISRIGEGSPASVWVSRAKAYAAAVQRAPSARSAANWRENPAVYSAFQRLMREEIFPGPGAQPIRKNGRVVGAVSTGGGLGPWTEIPGVDPGELMADGAPANAEDLIIACALQIPYTNQHDEGRRLLGPRVEERVDDYPHSLPAARRYADRAIAYARQRGLQPSIAVVDEAGQLMQMDRMDGGTIQSPDLAEAKALTALNFKRSSGDLGHPHERITMIQGIVHYRMLPVQGGLPISADGHVVGAIGVAGTGPTDEEIARAGIGG